MSYADYKNNSLWKIIEKELLELEENQDIIITTQREIVIGSLVKLIKDYERYLKSKINSGKL